MENGGTLRPLDFNSFSSIFDLMSRRGSESKSEYSTFFITTTVHKWLDIFTTQRFADIIIQSLDHYCRSYNAAIVSYVIMPNHIHFILHFKEDNKLGSFMRDFKKWTSVSIKEQLKNSKPERINDFHFSGPKGQTFKLWMDRYDHVYLVTRRIARIKMNYIHNNPVKKGMATFPEDFEFSSAGIYFKQLQPPVPFIHFNELF